jgi:hypothetical protein
MLISAPQGAMMMLFCLHGLTAIFDRCPADGAPIDWRRPGGLYG